MAAAISRNETTALTKSPTGKCVLPMLKPREEKSGLPTTAEINGVSKSFVNAVTTPPKAAPITTPTARSTTLPRNRNCRNPPAMCTPFNVIIVAQTDAAGVAVAAMLLARADHLLGLRHHG